MTVIQYVTEEVLRQGHDVMEVDGIERVGWMLNAWCYALSAAERKPEIADAILLGSMIEPRKNDSGIRRVGVRVGMKLCPHPKELDLLMVQLWRNRDAATPMEFYKEFEHIHPFIDGNGRTGKVLLNWLNGTLLRPIFPPADIFGYPIGNP